MPPPAWCATSGGHGGRALLPGDGRHEAPDAPWELEKTSTDLYVAPALLDVACPRTTVRPTAGLTLLHVDHPQLSGPRQVLKDFFDRSGRPGAARPLPGAAGDRRGGPALPTRARPCSPRLGSARTGVRSRSTSSARWWWTRRRAWPRSARRTSSTACCSRSARTRASRASARGCGTGRSTSCRSCSTCCRAKCRWSDRGPRYRTRPRRYADHVRRRLIVKPGLTGMWQVNGRSDLSWDESVRLDLRYVENWSLALDLNPGRSSRGDIQEVRCL